MAEGDNAAVPAAVSRQCAGWLSVVVGAYALNNVRLLLLSGIGKPYDPPPCHGGRLQRR